MLEWQLKNHKKLRHLDSFLRQKAAGAEIPFLRDIPEVLPLNRWLLQGYEILSTRRLMIDGRPQPIPISEIAAYADYTAITDEADRDDFLKCVCQLDGIALDFANGVAKAQAQADRKAQAAAARLASSKRRRR